MKFYKNPDMEHVIALYDDDKKWYMLFMNQGKFGWTPSKWVLKNDKNKGDDKNRISIDEVPKGILKSLIIISFRPGTIENFKRILG